MLINCYWEQIDWYSWEWLTARPVGNQHRPQSVRPRHHKQWYSSYPAIQLPYAVSFNSEYCHILMNIKIIFLIHKPLVLPTLLTAQKLIFFCDLFCMERFCSIFNTHYSIPMSSSCSNYSNCCYNKGCTYIMWEAELCLFIYLFILHSIDLQG